MKRKQISIVGCLLLAVTFAMLCSFNVPENQQETKLVYSFNLDGEDDGPEALPEVEKDLEILISELEKMMTEEERFAFTPVAAAVAATARAVAATVAVTRVAVAATRAATPAIQVALEASRTAGGTWAVITTVFGHSALNPLPTSKAIEELKNFELYRLG